MEPETRKHILKSLRNRLRKDFTQMHFDSKDNLCLASAFITYNSIMKLIRFTKKNKSFGLIIYSIGLQCEICVYFKHEEGKK